MEGSQYLANSYNLFKHLYVTWIHLLKFKTFNQIYYIHKETGINCETPSSTTTTTTCRREDNTSLEYRNLRYLNLASLCPSKLWIFSRYCKAVAPTPVLLPGKSHGQRSLEGCSPWGRWGSDTTEQLHFHFSLSCIGERNGNPLQYSCLENPRDRGACWAAVYGVAQSRTRLKWLSSSSRVSESCGNIHYFFSTNV